MNRLLTQLMLLWTIVSLAPTTAQGQAREEQVQIMRSALHLIRGDLPRGPLAVDFSALPGIHPVASDVEADFARSEGLEIIRVCPEDLSCQLDRTFILMAAPEVRGDTAVQILTAVFPNSSGDTVTFTYHIALDRSTGRAWRASHVIKRTTTG